MAEPIERRSFLQGLIASVAGSTALVTLASPTEAALLKERDPVRVVQETPRWDPTAAMAGLDVFVLGRKGTLIPVGTLRSITIKSERHAITSLDGSYEMYIPSSIRAARGEFGGFLTDEMADKLGDL